MPEPKTARGRRIVKGREPQLVEDAKRTLLVRGPRASALGKTLLSELGCVLAPLADKLGKDNEQLMPFENRQSIEGLCRLNDTPLFLLSSKTKKRPHGITFGRCFDFQVLDMAEFAVEESSFKAMKEVQKIVERTTAVTSGSKPLLLFNGEEFDHDPDFSAFKNLMIDMFRGQVVERLNLNGIERAIVFTSKEKTIFFRHYAIALTRNQAGSPTVALEEIGPRFDMKFSRRFSADDKFRATAMKQPSQLRIKHRKNVEKGMVGQVLGRVHMEKQNLDEMALRRIKKRKVTASKQLE
jgi:ribosome production factor 2